VTTDLENLGLLIDFDGVVSNLQQRRIVEPTMVDSLATLVNRGATVAFNTGRSAQLVDERAIALVRKVADHLEKPMFAACEKGGVVLTVNGDSTELWVDEASAAPADAIDATKALIATEFADIMRFEDDKRVMLSAERFVEIDDETFATAQKRYIVAMEPIIEGLDFVVDPALIATDIQHRRLGKDLGAERVVQAIGRHGHLPSTWQTLGDSAVDFAMARWLHDNGFSVTHIDVGRNPDPSDAHFDIVRPGGLAYDAAAAGWLSELVQ
jgi:hypothetical protein